MASILKSKVSTYEFKPDDIKKLIAADLQLPLDQVEVEFKIQDMSDDRFGATSYYQCTKIIVTVRHPLKD